MTEIKRTGPPTARDVKGRMITWAMPLSAMPDKDWRQFFNQTKDTTLVCTPKRVHMYQSLLVFESAEDDVSTWIAFIDKWTAAANARYAEWQAGRQPSPGGAAGTGGSASERERKLVELNEKFKDL